MAALLICITAEANQLDALGLVRAGIAQYCKNSIDAQAITGMRIEMPFGALSTLPLNEAMSERKRFGSGILLSNSLSLQWPAPSMPKRSISRSCRKRTESRVPGVV